MQSAGEHENFILRFGLFGVLPVSDPFGGLIPIDSDFEAAEDHFPVETLPIGLLVIADEVQQRIHVLVVHLPVLFVHIHPQGVQGGMKHFMADYAVEETDLLGVAERQAVSGIVSVAAIQIVPDVAVIDLQVVIAEERPAEDLSGGALGKLIGLALLLLILFRIFPAVLGEYFPIRLDVAGISLRVRLAGFQEDGILEFLAALEALLSGLPGFGLAFQIEDLVIQILLHDCDIRFRHILVDAGDLDGFDPDLIDQSLVQFHLIAASDQNDDGGKHHLFKVHDPSISFRICRFI